MGLLDTFIVFSVLGFLGLIIWSRIMNQRMLDTILEIKEIVRSMKEDV